MNRATLLSAVPLLTLLLAPADEARAIETGEQCCPIVLVDHTSRLVSAKNPETDQVFHFRADILDIRSLRVGDLVSADFESGRITGIAGANRDYAMLMRDGDDCCVVRDIDETSGMAVAIDPNSGEAYRFKVAADDIGSVTEGATVAIDPSSGGVTVGSFEPIHGAADKIEAHLEPDWQDVCCPAMPNAQLTGATGRLAIATMEDSKAFSIQVYKAATDERSKSWYSNEGLTANLLPGKYDVVVNGMKLEDVYLGRGMDTQIRTGALNIMLESGTSWAVYRKDGETRVAADYGSAKIVLPIGTYFVALAGDMMEVAIIDGRVTDF
jgi:hypothetical protein